MENKKIAREIKRLGQLMELHGENSFKTKAYEKAARVISKYPLPLKALSTEERGLISGIGKSINLLLTELLLTGQISALQTLEEQTPAGVLQMVSAKGIGPKKAAVIWQNLGIDSLAALWHACKNNELAQAKGFGAKTQLEIQGIIEFLTEHEGQFRYADVSPIAQTLSNELEHLLPSSAKVQITGDLRRCVPLIKTIDLLLTANGAEIQSYLNQIPSLTDIEHVSKDNLFTAMHTKGVPIRVWYSDKNNFANMLIRLTGNQRHTEALYKRIPKSKILSEDESALYNSAGLAYIPPELREDRGELAWAESNQLPELIQLNDIKGCIHNHSTWSDGVFSIKAMAEYCRDILHLQYFGISDHSKTAAYAGGLSIDKVQKQWEEIDQLNKEIAPFRVFKGIESDILNNGKLDYPHEILSEFDFVVSSIHAPLSMDEDRATQRLIKAIENPYTTILGHPTGRQLLIRKGYPINHKKVIDACADNGVVIEINSNPLRLDLDWTWLSYCIEKEVLISINPDAHHTSELHYMEHGIRMARKGGIQAENCLNCLNLEEIDAYFSQRRKRVI